MEKLQTQVSKPRLLIIDDVPAYLSVLVAMLSEFYEIQVTTSGADAISLLHHSLLPDLILLDIMMPGIDGYGVCREIKRQVATQHIPVIFITALDEKTDEILGFEAGAADYISKPFEPDLVLARVRNQLRYKFVIDSLRNSTDQQPVIHTDCVFRSMGLSWEISFQGQSCFQLKDMLGLAYLQCLVAHPGRYFSVEEIVFLSVVKEREFIFSRSASRIDNCSINYYRLLTEEVIEGRKRQSMFPGASSLINGSVEHLLGELRRAGILASDALSAIDDRERYRKSVGNAIRRAVREISEHDLPLSCHLQFPNLRLGYELVYVPEKQILWQV